MKCIRDNETKSYFNYIKKKHSVIKVSEFESIDGQVSVKSIRKYQTYQNYVRYEVDIEFKGSIWGRGSYRPHMQKFEHRDLPNLSKVKLYRAMRKKVLDNLKSKLSLFGVEINRPEHISKIKWVG
jgi:hypothetical protein